MKIVETYWVGGTIGFVKVFNGFEHSIYCGVAQGINEQEDSEWIARHGAKVSHIQLGQFLDLTGYTGDYITSL